MTTFPGNADLPTSSNLSATGGLYVTTLPGTEIRVVTKYLGDKNVPGDVRRRRRWIYDAMRRLGTPVLIKHMYNAIDVENGIAEPSAVWDSVYGQTRKDDPLSHGAGYVSIEKSSNEWYNKHSGEIFASDEPPGDGYTRAPKYRGFGPGLLTYVVEPDRAEDWFKLHPSGALIRVQNATAQAPWYPLINDNDLLINVVIKGDRVAETQERYQAKMVNPVTIRGLDRRGLRQIRGEETAGNRFLLNQQFDMALLPDNHVLYNVETDR